MGREVEATVTWKGQTGLARMLLESTEIILRGEVRGRVSRRTLSDWSVADDDLVLTTPEGRLVATMGAIEAQKWANALSKPLPSLAQKMGFSSASPAFLLGQTEDEELGAAILQGRSDDVGHAAQIVAVIETAEDLAASLKLAASHETLPVWCVYPKGKGDGPRDAGIRAAFRDMGWIDVKTSAVSDRLTATRYIRRTS